MAGLYPRQMLIALSTAGVRFVLVGGIAAAVHKAIHETTDMDLLCNLEPDNLERLATALTALQARLRGSPHPPRPIDPSLLVGVKLITFDTCLGELDLLFEAVGGFTYNTIAPQATTFTVEGHAVQVVSRTDLITMKRAAGRPKDIAVVGELEALEILEQVEPPTWTLPDGALGSTKLQTDDTGDMSHGRLSARHDPETPQR